MPTPRIFNGKDTILLTLQCLWPNLGAAKREHGSLRQALNNHAETDAGMLVERGGQIKGSDL
jgi:hypothetical protein